MFIGLPYVACKQIMVLYRLKLVGNPAVVDASPMLTEIRDHKKFVGTGTPNERKKMRINLIRKTSDRSAENRVGCPYLSHSFKKLYKIVCRLIMHQIRFESLSEVRPVNPAAVVVFSRIIFVAVIVKYSPLITQVEQRNAANAVGYSIQHLNPFNAQIDFILIVFIHSLFQPGQ